MSIKEFIIKNREAAQIGYGIILIILIPLLIAYNTISIVKRYNGNFDVALQRQAMTIGRSIYALIRDDLGDQAIVQKKIEDVSGRNPDIEELSVLVRDGDNFKIAASSNKGNVGKSVSFYYYNVAWTKKDNEVLATDSMRLSAIEGGEELEGSFSSDDRFWLAAMPMIGTSGQKEALLTMKFSSKIIDDLTNDTRSASSYLLIATIIIVILFLTVSVGLWDYAVLYRKIREVDKMKDEFISIASHELRTPVTLIKGYLSMVTEGAFGKIPNPEMEKGINMAIKASKRLEMLVEDLLNVSRIEQGRLEVNNINLEVGPIVEEVVSQFKVQAAEKNLALEYAAPSEKLPQVVADPERLKQVLINLIGNAIKYTEKGSVKVTTQFKNEMVEIKIVDTGIGMSADDQQRLFQKFYRVQNEKTQKIIGTGLGLWITKQIIELMKGKITLESMEGVGTQATVKLSLAAKK